MDKMCSVSYSDFGDVSESKGVKRRHMLKSSEERILGVFFNRSGSCVSYRSIRRDGILWFYPKTVTIYMRLDEFRDYQLECLN